MKDGTAYRHKESGRIYFYVSPGHDIGGTVTFAICRHRNVIYCVPMVEFLEEFEEVTE